ncbi:MULTISPECIES: cell envelope integrity protein TolA [Pseudomonas syringae group]|uniref:Cell envelope integrity protein TolA n=4 Tax=Pseudomonas syringae group TaxID=136849 RepID=A0A8T8C4K8_PSEYM|nr:MULTISPECIES: cell envelope integrity protein TolA [Pseudomonas syringae group]KAA8705077.1 cell envelope integrity protein TolA [Pseudomonas cannabina]KPB72237.1 TonB [Pseudomonas syringae pv. maculicola]KPW24733.1 TonB [Pseudomonas cannabina pv. alisalensis]MBM0142251.1 cell envelope integrity protein TolA [Pseudomonas cannabina pv. alisalensis]QHE98163.1 cell envelope integrity protein TolA [Pseudomonas syringae pv. maculicola str. ES4326]
MQPIREPSASESYFWPSVWAVALHILIFGMLFVSFAMTPDLPEAKPIVQATLYQLKSKSQATTQTNQKIAGEAKKTAARQTEVEQLEQKKIEQLKQEAVKAAEQKKEEAAQKAEDQKAAEEAKKSEQKAEEAKKADDAKKADEAKKVADAKKVEEKQLADIAKKKAEDEAKKKAEEDAKKAAAEEAKKQAADEAKKKAAEDAKKKAAEDAKKKAAADSAKKAQEAARKSAEDKKAQALADLLSDKPERQQALADERGDETAGSFDDLIRVRASEGWSRPPSARNNMSVTLQIGMLPDGTIASVSIAKSSGDGPFDSSAVAAVKNIGRLTEMQGLKPADFAPYRSFKMTFTPGDLAL